MSGGTRGERSDDRKVPVQALSKCHMMMSEGRESSACAQVTTDQQLRHQQSWEDDHAAELEAFRHKGCGRHRGFESTVDADSAQGAQLCHQEREAEWAANAGRHKEPIKSYYQACRLSAGLAQLLCKKRQPVCSKTTSSINADSAP